MTDGMGIGVLVAGVSMALGLGVYAAIRLLTRRRRGLWAVLGAIWCTAALGALLPWFWLLLDRWTDGRIEPGHRDEWWMSQLLAAALTIGYVVGYRTVARLAGPRWLAAGGSAKGSSLGEVDLLVQFLCRQAGMRTHQFMIGQVARLLADRKEDVPTFRQKLLDDPDLMKEATSLLSWGATSFFREPRTLAHVLDVMRRRQAPTRVRILGCSSGQEAYSVAILADLAGLADARIDASDISTQGVAFARQGIYHRQAFDLCAGREGPGARFLDAVLSYPLLGHVRVRRDLLTRYFDPVGHEAYQAREDLRAKIDFRVQNLLDDADYRGYQWIFFRNVIPHLEPAVTAQTFRTLHRCSDSDTLLVLSRRDVTRLAGQTAEALASLFEPVDPTGRVPIFRKRPLPSDCGRVGQVAC